MSVDRPYLGIALIALLGVAGCGGPADMGAASRGTGMGGDMMGGGVSANRPVPNTVASSFWNIQSLKTAPKTELVRESVEGEVTLKEVKYSSPASAGKDLMIFAYYAYPTKRSGKLPAIVVVHGGRGLAEKAAVMHWATQGYAALAIELPGKGGGRESSRSEGPDMIDPEIFKVTPSPKDCYLYSAVNSVCRGISFLAGQPEVDAGRVGVVGYSWGGVITLIANGIDDRVSAACTVFGAGYIPEESTWVTGALAKFSAKEKKTWREHFDPSSYLKTQHGRTLFVGATQDTYYPLRSFLKTYQSADCEKVLCLVANKNHALDDAASNQMSRWFAWALKDGPSFPKITAKKSGNAVEVSAKGNRPIVEVEILTAAEKDYAKAVWESAAVKGGNGTWKIEPPKDASYFVQAKDDNGAVIVEQVHLTK